MSRVHSAAQQFREAKIIANDYGLFIVEKPDGYLLYRKLATRNDLVGRRGTAEAMRKLVIKVTGFH